MDARDLVIADEQTPMCLAGVYGGAHSGVSDATTKVLIEAAGREMEPEQTEVQGLAEQRQGLIDKVRKDGEVMSNSEQAQIQKDIEAIEIDLQFLSQKLQKTVQDKRQEILVALAPKFEKVRNDLIQIEGFDMIAAPNALVYVNPKNDITKKITERMNEQSD